MRKKNILLIVVSSLLLLLTTLHTPIGSQLHLQIMKPVTADPNKIVPIDYPKIQDAINAADLGDTIYVYNGTYYEHVIVNKTVTLIGENRSTAIIDGNGTGIVIKVTADNVNVTGFTIRNGGDFPDSTVFIGNYINNTIRDSIIRNSGYGLTLIGSNGCSIINNVIMDCSWAGVQIKDSNDNNIHGNTIANNSIGVWVTSDSSLLTKFYHNNFIDNLNQVSDFGSGTIWDDGYLSGGNYWSDYTGEDSDGDGIGDTYVPHLGLDNYPLMKPFGDTGDITPPVADAGPDQMIFQGMTVTFDGSGSYDDVSIKSYMWTFTDETLKALTGFRPTYRFKNVGNFDVTLNVTDYFGKWDTNTMWANVSADNAEPTISNLSQEPTLPAQDEEVTVSVDVTDEQSGVSNVTLSYRMNSGTWNNVSMSKFPENNTWNGEILGQPAGTNVTYWIFAYDNAENPAVDDDGGQYYVYTVVPEFPAAIFLLLFIIFTLVTVTLRMHACALHN